MMSLLGVCSKWIRSYILFPDYYYYSENGSFLIMFWEFLHDQAASYSFKRYLYKIVKMRKSNSELKTHISNHILKDEFMFHFHKGFTSLPFQNCDITSRIIEVFKPFTAISDSRWDKTKLSLFHLFPHFCQLIPYDLSLLHQCIMLLSWNNLTNNLSIHSSKTLSFLLHRLYLQHQKSPQEGPWGLSMILARYRCEQAFIDKLSYGSPLQRTSFKDVTLCGQDDVEIRFYVA